MLNYTTSLIMLATIIASITTLVIARATISSIAFFIQTAFICVYFSINNGVSSLAFTTSIFFAGIGLAIFTANIYFGHAFQQSKTILSRPSIAIAIIILAYLSYNHNVNLDSILIQQQYLIKTNTFNSFFIVTTIFTIISVIVSAINLLKLNTKR